MRWPQVPCSTLAWEWRPALGDLEDSLLVQGLQDRRAPAMARAGRTVAEP